MECGRRREVVESTKCLKVGFDLDSLSDFLSKVRFIKSRTFICGEFIFAMCSMVLVSLMFEYKNNYHRHLRPYHLCLHCHHQKSHLFVAQIQHHHPVRGIGLSHRHLGPPHLRLHYHLQQSYLFLA